MNEVKTYAKIFFDFYKVRHSRMKKQLTMFAKVEDILTSNVSCRTAKSSLLSASKPAAMIRLRSP
jgi:hypothetical protein